jgi:drug/metabolite transporter (DMT)-like permease
MWIFLSIAAALIWGIDYALTEKVLKRIQFTSLLTIELFFGLLVMLALTLLSGSYKGDWQTLLGSKQTMLFTLAIVVSFNIGTVLITLAIGSKNATLAGLVEISYPLFIALFSWLFFKDVDVSPWTALGGTLVFIGVGVIYLSNK